MNSGIFLSFGTNMGDRLKNLEMARHLLEIAEIKVTAISSVYKTAPWGNTDQPDFFNQVVRIATSLSPEELLKRTMEIEVSMGRERLVHWGPRIIDIDILLYNDQVVNEKNLIIPHPAMALRKFVLEPFAEIAPGSVHTTLLKDISTLLKECTDAFAVEKVL